MLDFTYMPHRLAVPLPTSILPRTRGGVYQLSARGLHGALVHERGVRVHWRAVSPELEAGTSIVVESDGSHRAQAEGKGKQVKYG